MTGATGSVEVAFSVSAAGTTLVQSVTGPDLLKKAAEEAVGSWVFRRTRADRAYLIAVFTYGGDKATAIVQPQPPPAPGAKPVPERAAAPATSDVPPPQLPPVSPPQP
jgi:hypothetical protein